MVEVCDLMRHEYDCEVYPLADLLKDMLRYEEDIDDYDSRKRFSVLVDDLIDCVKEVNSHIGDLTQEAQNAVFQCEVLEDDLYAEREIIDDLRDTHRQLINQMDESIRQLKAIYE